ncbi:MAG: glycosyltransferase [Bacteroidales bacterium]|nr:glycosyltransferase [Bacteroidales bacterium]
MNVLHLLSWFPTPDDPYSGNFCLKHIRAVSEHVHSVVLSAYPDEKVSRHFEVEVADYPNFKYVVVRVRPARNRWVRKIRLFLAYQHGLEFVEKNFFHPDLVHQHVTLPVGRIALFWKKTRHIPYVLTEHWTIYQPQNSAMMTPRVRKRIGKIANNAEKILPVSYDLQCNMQKYGIHAPFQVVPNVVDVSLFLPGQGSGDGKKHILHISTLRDEAKNVSGIFRVLKRLSEKRCDFVLDVVHDYRRPDLECYVKDNSMEEMVRFHGRKTEKEIAAFYARAHFFLLFSNFENLPCVLIESFACGLPVVTTDVGGIREIVDDSRGRVLRAGDEDKLLETLDFMLDHYADFDAVAIRKYAEEHFSMEVIGHQIAAVYHDVFQ